MKKFGLALSGGGFRATLYHLGLLRFLRDANLLQNVSHVTAVSGGSVIAAHLGLNWQRYTGSASEFDEVASELLAFVQLDVRNRILRRYGLALILGWPFRLVGLSPRRFTRTGFLEEMYEKHLYGDTSLFQLPESPSVHLLTTNLSEGRLCSFNRDGLWTIRPDAANGLRFDHVSTSLATVAMAVTASSAFPGFFPPLVLTGADVGANKGEFDRLAFTDGGVFDNLGIRMFRFLERSLGEDKLPWEAVLVSDVGRQFEIQTSARTGGLVRTGMRASEILMNRVWQLENETVQNESGFIFSRVTHQVDPHQDSTAPHPEIQKQLPNVRTDLDCFSPVEISNLVRHGYCVGRKACRSAPEIFGTELPDNTPWDPMQLPTRSHAVAVAPGEVPPKEHDDRQPVSATLEARALYASAGRRIWSRLLDFRDWVSWIYVPLILPILILLPYFIIKNHERSQRMTRIVESLAQGSRDLEQMSRLLDGPVEPWVGPKAEEIPPGDKPDMNQFVILQDSRIVDLRKWKASASTRSQTDSMLYGYRRLKVLKKLESTGASNFRVSVLAYSPNTQVRFPTQQLVPRFYSERVASPDGGEPSLHYEIEADFRKVPAGESVDVMYEHASPGTFLRSGIESTTLTFEVEMETVELTRWLLLPPGKEYRNYHLIRYETGKPETTENVSIVTKYLSDDSTILAFKLLSLKAGYTYELTWFYQ